MRATRWCAAAMLAFAASELHPAAAGQLGSRPTEEWVKLLDSPARTAGLRIQEIVSKLQLEPGQVIADIGAGTGTFTLPLARAVGPSGKVYAVEVDRGLVEHIRRRAGEEKAGNVQAVLGRFGDPALPARDVDLAFFHDALHHISDRTGYLARLTAYLKPQARIAVVEMDPVKGAHRDEPGMQVSKAQLRGWMTDLGFTSEAEADLADDKWFATYVRRLH